MIATILSFAISLTLLAGILGYKIVRLRRGEILPESNHTPLSLVPEHINFDELEKDAIEHAKRYGHEILLFALRSWIRSGNFIRREKKMVIEKVKSWMPHKHKEVSKKAVSQFLQNVSEYKAKLNKMKEEIRAEEEQNF